MDQPSQINQPSLFALRVSDIEAEDRGTIAQWRIDEINRQREIMRLEIVAAIDKITTSFQIAQPASWLTVNYVTSTTSIETK